MLKEEKFLMSHEIKLSRWQLKSKSGRTYKCSRINPQHIYYTNATNKPS